MSPAVRACIGLGANIGDPVAALLGAFTALAGLPESRVIATSRLYRTPAWGGVEQPDYINAAALLETRLSAQELLRHLLNIEHCAGRRRDAEAAALRWGPRVLDLDLLLYASEVIHGPGLRVPHPHMHERAFVLVPLADIAPEAEIPGRCTVEQALRRVDAGGIVPIASASA